MTTSPTSDDAVCPDQADLSDLDVVVAVLGAGVMGGAVLSGMLAAGLPPESAVVTAPSEGTRRTWADRGIRATADNVEAARGADVVVLGVKPYAVASVLDEIAGVLTPDTVVVSLAAGVRLATLVDHAGPGVPIMRVMPNTPALVGQGVLVITPGEACSPAHQEMVDRLLSSCGVTEFVPESLQDAAGALSGSGPAYVFYVAEALVEGGVYEGLPRPLATRLVAQTLVGAAAMLSRDDESASVLRERVTSPGGSTARALRALDAGAVRHHVAAAVSAAARRASELGG